MKITILIIAAIFISIIINAQTGPGGIGSTSTNGLWLKADELNLSNGAVVSSWADVSGNSNDANQSTADDQPKFYTTSNLNSLPVVRFDGNDQMLINDADILDGTVGITYFAVVRPSNLSNKPLGILGKRIYYTDPNTYSYDWFFYNSGNFNLDINNSSNRLTTAEHFFNSTNYLLSMDFDGNRVQSVRSKIYSAGVMLKEGNDPDNAVRATTSPLTIGALNQDYGNYLGGDYAEIIHFNYALNVAERVIVDNYLSAKYDISISDNKYVGDDSGNGDYDFNVIGVGTDVFFTHYTSDDAKGLSLSVASGFADGDYVFAGNRGEQNYAVTSDISAPVEVRWKRVWYIDITNSGTIDLTFDFSDAGVSQTPSNASNYELLYRSSQTGDYTVFNSTLSVSINDDKVTFNNVSLSDANDGYFTIGTVDESSSSLPIELIGFNVNIKSQLVNIDWQTASETNNDYFTIERSQDAQNWDKIEKVYGAGNSNIVQEYNYTDCSALNGMYYYRLKQTDYDGAYTYSEIRIVEISNAMKVYPNPTTNKVFIRLESGLQGEIRVFNTLGQDVSNKVSFTQESKQDYKLDLYLLPKGVYFIRTTDAFAKVYKN